MASQVPVFIVEDSPHMQSALRDLMQAVGPFDVVGAAGSETQATDWLLHHKKWDLAIVDLMLAEGSGFTLIPRCRRVRPNGKIVVFSEYATPGVKERCQDLGADAVFMKSEMSSLVHYLEAQWPRAPI